MDVYEEDLVWLASRVREIRASMQSSSTAKPAISKHGALNEGGSDGLAEVEPLQTARNEQQGTDIASKQALQAEKDLQFAAAHVGASQVGPEKGSVL